MTRPKAFIIAARRAANGRLGGLHRNRRIADLAAPIVSEALGDAHLSGIHVDLMVLGNIAAGSNPARLVALVSGLADRVSAMTIDRHWASGLEAIAVATRAVEAGDAEVAIAGGAESLSTAPWRLAKPRTLYHMPRLMGAAQIDEGEHGDLALVEATETLARRLGITRSQQDEFAITSHIKAGLARGARKLAAEIVPLKAKPEEGRDELAGEPDMDELEALPTLLGDGTLTSGNTSLPADGGAFVVVVSERRYNELGRPPAMVVAGMAALGVAAEHDIEAPIHAYRALAGRLGGLPSDSLAAIELAEASAAQAIAFRTALGLGEAPLNTDGGQIARGIAGGAAGAVLVTRLFSRLVRDDASGPGARGIAVTGAGGGQGLAMLLERV